ncbi:hypothetical protein IU486_13445 [Streptomyces gardneri]|nr:MULTISPECIES: hypothetical protein [Nocardia]MBF6165776.1 hypothetical protein [Streptomyces gardneri]MBF6203099.1 hypothetical protein [Streptomyces gardneri]UAK29963.1 hypothetical protein K8O92_18465 [Nocardia asteroides]
MVSQDTLAQLRQDITTAEDAGDEANAERLRRELAEAMREAGKSTETDQR